MMADTTKRTIEDRRGHAYRVCGQPISSYGIICYRRSKGAVREVVEYVMVQRKDSLSYVEFIRGKYNLQNRGYLLRLFGAMTRDERRKLATEAFEDLWHGFWQSDHHRSYMREYEQSRSRYELLRSGYYLRAPYTKALTPFSLEIALDSTSSSTHEDCEFGFPKGRMNAGETEVQCSLREFEEETGVPSTDIRLVPGGRFEEVFVGSNQVRYRHIYYLAELDEGSAWHSQPSGVHLPVTDPVRLREVKAIGWFCADAVIARIRPEHAERRQLFGEAAFGTFSLTVDLKRESAQESYDPKEGLRLRRLNTHLGQRKLLVSEVQFLNDYYGGSALDKEPKAHPVVVYVGAAPGTHLLFMRLLYPEVSWVLYDGAAFDSRLRRYPETFELHNGYFTDAVCDALMAKAKKQRPLLFVCDMRSDAADHDQFESQVMRDMVTQGRWLRRMQPALSLLKFRLPYTLRDGDKVPYLHGTLRFGVWSPGDSGETRLLVTAEDAARPTPRRWDFGAYERALFYHNKNVRRSCFEDQVPPEFRRFAEGDANVYCSCYDCVAEMHAYRDYLAIPQLLKNTPNTPEAIVKAYADLVTDGTPSFPRSKVGGVDRDGRVRVVLGHRPDVHGEPVHRGVLSDRAQEPGLAQQGPRAQLAGG
ncbi:hypothetical protein CEUSTIGMA_g11912.t1 [Chlamydomonas eustigma]|uniref:Cap-specific mRNA (nucleoside-2'-O-)-methyltransferase n=1 Tax=Chlamydomonas eustigma TaxID=1157962 RepID=A0A250XNK4_9CHLO|nr:hypothetical protein CEUSTIGMA_g11912.t1 [Chlamydomonas eustigma]|eukprot:GAX84492.1 hypothetical protein CEUSTIGMA_g11912.t1 [Chlamydomonas eustigma]